MSLLYRIKISRLVRVLSNLKHVQKLRANAALYEKYGIKKKVWHSISHEAIAQHTDNCPWLDGVVTDADIRQAPGFASFTNELQNQLLLWPERGYLILPKFFSDDRIEAAEKSITEGLSKTDNQKYLTNRLVNLYRTNPTIEKLFKDAELLKILSFVLGREIAPFQTINFHRSSSQVAHSDAVHLTTEPLGHSIGVWVALEDVVPGSGEFFYYPGSHKLGYIMNSDYSDGSSNWLLGKDVRKKYEEKIEAFVQENALTAQTFLPAKGDILIWHTNLIHGSQPKTNPALTRKSLIMHYFSKGVLCYHEMVQKPAVFQ